MVIFMANLASRCVKPHNRILHSVAKATISIVMPKAEKLNRLRKVIRNPNPPTNMILTSNTTKKVVKGVKNVVLL